MGDPADDNLMVVEVVMVPATLEKLLFVLKKQNVSGIVGPDGVAALVLTQSGLKHNIPVVVVMPA